MHKNEKNETNLNRHLLLALTLVLSLASVFSEANSNLSVEDAPVGGEQHSVDAIDVCFSPAEACDETLIRFIESARESLDIAIYSFTHAQIADAILAAHARGVRVRVIADRTQAKSKSSKVSELMKAGVPIKVIFGSSYRGSMHHKYTILDGRILQTGSFNYSNNAAVNNFENQIYLRDKKTLNRFQNSFESLWSLLAD